MNPYIAIAPEKTATLSLNQNKERVIKITFPFSYETLDRVRTITGRKYHAEDKCWSAPVHEEAIKSLIEWGFIVDPRLLEFLQKVSLQVTTFNMDGIKGLKGKLYPFQNEGVAFIESRKGRALIADEMGLGKTIQALAWLQLHLELRPAIIVVPASLKLNWKKEAAAWMPSPQSEILHGNTPWVPTGRILIINYDVLPAWVEMLRGLQPKVLITDECHYYKSNKARRTKAVKMLGKGMECVIALSGTPIVNRPIEMYNAINLVNPVIFPNAWNFVKRYCNARQTGFGWDLNGSSNTGELHQKLVGSIMLRRLKADVLKELPPKTYSFTPMELNNWYDYKMAEKDLIRWLLLTRGREAAIKASSAEQLVKFEQLKQLAVKGKIDNVINWIDDFLEVDGKLVVFAFHTAIIDKLMEKFGKIAVRYDGSVSEKKKEEHKEAFQNDPNIRLFVGNLKAAGVGLTLTAASNVAIIELPWTPGDLDQCIARLDRIGQAFAVNVHYLLAENTVEERIAKLIDSKRYVLDAVLDGKVTEQNSLLSELIKSYLNESTIN